MWPFNKLTRRPEPPEQPMQAVIPPAKKVTYVIPPIEGAVFNLCLTNLLKPTDPAWRHGTRVAAPWTKVIALPAFDLDQQDPAAGGGQSQGQGRRHRGLAGAALARDDVQPHAIPVGIPRGHALAASGWFLPRRLSPLRDLMVRRAAANLRPFCHYAGV